MSTFLEYLFYFNAGVLLGMFSTLIVATLSQIFWTWWIRRR